MCTAFSLDQCYKSRLLFHPEDGEKKKKNLVKLDQRFQASCKTKKVLSPTLSLNGLSEHKNLGQRNKSKKPQALYLDSVRVREYAYLVDI